MTAQSKLREKLGKPPGTLVYTGTPSGAVSEYTLIKYSEKGDETHTGKSLDDILPHLDKKMVNWINLDGIHNVDQVERTGRHFGLHSLVLEDILNVQHPPKIEIFADYVFMSVKMLRPGAEEGIEEEQLSLVLTEDKLLSFQEKSGDVFDPIRERIANPQSKVRQRKSDYLLYYLVDLVVDNYFLVMDDLTRDIEELESDVLEDPGADVTQQVNAYRKKISRLRRTFYQVKDSIRELKRAESDLLQEYVYTYFNDVSEHLQQLINSTDVLMESLQGLAEMHMTIISTRMNKVMYTLTIVATIFIPLTFIAGVYGMNFIGMPELQWKYGYPAALLLMLIVGVGMYVYMKRKRWF